MKQESSRQIFEKNSNIKFHENPSSGSGALPYGQTDCRKDRETRLSYQALFVSLRKAPKKYRIIRLVVHTNLQTTMAKILKDLYLTKKHAFSIGCVYFLTLRSN